MSNFIQTEIDQIKIGDIVLVRNTGLIPNLIRKFMDLDRKRRGLPKRKLWTHSAMVVDLWGTKYVAEAEAKGIQVNTFSSRYGGKKDRVKILTPKKSYSNAEKEKISQIAIEDSLNPTRYDYLGLLQQIKYSLTGKWPGKSGSKAEKRMYCTEAVATWVNKVRPDTFINPESTNPLDIDLNKYYKEKGF